MKNKQKTRPEIVRLKHINKIQIRKIIEKINETNNWFF